VALSVFDRHAEVGSAVGRLLEELEATTPAAAPPKLATEDASERLDQQSERRRVEQFIEIEVTEVEALQPLMQRVEVELRRPDGDPAVTVCGVVPYQVGNTDDDRHDEERHPRPDQ
jgi:hypothetical protein